jgi:hypothetical protein
VERKLSQMILDKSLSGILEQGKGYLVLYEPAREDTSFSRGVEIIANMEDVVDALSSRAKALTVRGAKENELKKKQGDEKDKDSGEKKAEDATKTK